ncbi:hypothetical protein [Variovorax sp. OK605]|uniref:hypothetical protein n=1 Tax=Variovorax sp. OK605 TaxID=1855317 RepID=UPI0011603405|nr:hypothetical protein [Variovorax sp. OK605]
MTTTSGIFKNSNSYFWLMLATTLGHVIFMRFFFQERWGETHDVTTFTRQMANFVPMIGALEKFRGYGNYWGIFYSIFWVLSPVFLICGYMSAYFSRGKGLDFIERNPIWKYFLFLLLFLCATVFLLFIPDAGTKFWFNELSNNLLVITFTCLEISGVIFLAGRAAGIVQFKLTKKYFNTER